MTCRAARRSPAAPQRFVAVERSVAGDRILREDNRFAPAEVGGTIGMKVFADEASAHAAAEQAVNRRSAVPVIALPLRGPVSIGGGAIRSDAIGAVIVAAVIILAFAF